MKALVKAKPEVGLWMQEVSEPGLTTPTDVKIKIQKNAICGTDIHIYQWDEWSRKTIPTPMVIGHEYMGIVAEVGEAVTHIKVGDRVSGEGHIVTNARSRNYYNGKLHLVPETIGVGVNRPGAFAEYLVIPAMNVFKLPEFIDDDVATIFDPFGNAVHSALSFDMVAEDVLITGAGPIGIMAAAVCQQAGARNIVISDVNAYRLELATKVAPQAVAVNATTVDWRQLMDDLGIVEGFDIGLEMSGNAGAIDQMLNNMINGGRIALLGIPPGNAPFAMEKVIFKGLFLKGIYGREMFETWYKMTKLVQSGLNLHPVITHHFAIDDFQQGFATMMSGQSGKVILHWD